MVAIDAIAVTSAALFTTVVVTVAIAHHAIVDKDAIHEVAGNVQVLNNDINRKQGIFV